MKKLYVSEDWFSIQQVAQMLQANSIPYMVKNEFASGAIGELAPQDAQPEVWLLDADWYAKANELLDDLRHVAADGTEWICPECDERNGSSFEVCWHCGTCNPALARTA